MSSQTVDENDVSNQEETVTIPRRSPDYDAPLRETLTDNVYENVLPARYLNRDEEGNLTEEPEEIFGRVAQNIAEQEKEFGGTDEDVENWKNTFEFMMENQLFMPNSPCLMNAGDDLQQLSACFVLNPDDSMEDITDTVGEAAEIFKSGGGVGYDFSQLRPMGSPVSTTGGVSSGPVSFMEIYDAMCGTIKQGGVRRGAQMGILRADHADIARFCLAKRVEGEFSNFNISVAVTDEFREAVENGDTYTFYSPQSDHTEPQVVRRETRHLYSPEYADAWNESLQKVGADEEGNVVEENIWRDYADELSPDFVEKWKDSDALDLTIGEEMELPAEFIWGLIVDGAYWNGEPGIFNLDAANFDHSYDIEEHPEMKIRGTNPCAEQPLLHGEACNLGHINLSMIVDEDAPMWSEYDGSVTEYVHDAVDAELLKDLTQNGVRFLDNVVTASRFPLDEISETVENNRKIGLGIMGLHHMLIQMGFEYGGQDSLTAAHEVMNLIRGWAVQESHALGIERGTFGNWEKSKYANPTEHEEWFIRHVGLSPEEHRDGFEIRNHNLLTVAPTGTTSMLGDTSGGCEPIYNVAYMKNVGDDIQGADYLVEMDNYFVSALEANGIDPDEIREVAHHQMMNNQFDGVHNLPIPQEIADLFVTTQEVSFQGHSKMQRVLQAAVDSGISKTLNAPNSATRSEVDEIMRFALRPRSDAIGDPSKGFTVYRDGSRMEQVNTVRADNDLDSDEDEEEEEEEDDLGPDPSEGLEMNSSAEELFDIEEKEDDEIVREECPDCGNMMESREGTCDLCPECGWSACSI